MPSTRLMKAIIIEGDALTCRDDVPVLPPGPTEVRVRVQTAGVNFADLMRKASHFAEAGGGAPIAGLEFAGIVIDAGRDVRGIVPGDRVMAMSGSGYAEYACVDHRLVSRVPDHLDWAQAAAIMVSFMTAHDALCTHGGLRAGSTVLVQGCTSGVGIAASQLAAYLRAAAVIGTSTTTAKLTQMASFGVSVGVNVREQSVPEVVHATTSGRGADVIVDAVGGAAALDNLKAAAIGARWISVGRVDGKVGEFELNEFARKRLSLIGVTFRTRTLLERIQIVERFNQSVLPGLAAGLLRPKVDSVFRLEEADAAQAHVRSGRHFGKVVLQVTD